MPTFHSLRHAARTLLRSPGFALVAVLTLALGIGVNTTIFSVVNAVMLRPLPYANPDRLVTAFHFYPSLNGLEAGAAAPTFRDLKENTKSFESVAVQARWGANFTSGPQPERLTAAKVTGEFFSVFGVPAALGRTLVPDDAGTGRDAVVVISDGFWKRAFGADRRVLGRTMQVNGRAYEIVGVMPPTFHDFFDREIEAWAPLVLTPAQYADDNRTNEFLQLSARLKPGVSTDQAERELAALAERLKQDHRGSYPPDWTLRLRSLAEQGTATIRPALMVLLGAVGFVLLIACGNVANLLLARAASRKKEVAVRCALGATGRDLVRQLLSECLLLSVVGGALGLALAYGGLRLLVALNPANLPWISEVSIDRSVLLFTLVVSLVTGLVFGLLPALQVVRTDLQSTLREGGRSGGADSRGLSARRALVVAEIGLALMLLVGAGLLIRSFANLQRTSPGFNPEGVVTMSVALPAGKYGSDTAQIAFFDALLLRLAAMPGVQGVGAVSDLPFGGGGTTRSFLVEGLVLKQGEPSPWGDFRIVDARYHRTMQVPLVRGRLFTTADRMGSQPVAIVDEELANRYWPGQDPIGKRIGFPQEGAQQWIDVVGVVSHTAQEGVDGERRSQVYLPHMQVGGGTMSIVLRATGDPTRLVPGVRSVVASLDPEQPVSHVRTMEDLVEAAVGPRRFSMLLLTVFSALALLLASVGIYGVTSFDVARRSQEIGIRMALGAEARTILALVLRQGMRLLAVGVGLGLVGALLLTRLIASQLYGVGALDPLTILYVVVLLVGIVVLATLIPARRATRVDPLDALRAE